MARLAIFAHPPARGHEIRRRRELTPDQAIIVTKPSHLRVLGVLGIPALFDASAWNSPHADAFADYVAWLARGRQ